MAGIELPVIRHGLFRFGGGREWRILASGQPGILLP
jgi:hypothetical protein